MSSECESPNQIDPVSEPVLSRLLSHAIYGCERVNLARLTVINGNVGSQARLDVGMQAQVMGNVTSWTGNVSLSRLATVSGQVESGGRFDWVIHIRWTCPAN